MTYIKRLNPKCKSFFQQPRKEVKDGIYYNNVPLGHNLLGSMMKKISINAKLSRQYTNHSLRATTVHLLDVAQFPSRHIMAITGHKSENSLKTYTGQTSDSTKKLMSGTLNEKTNGTTRKILTTKCTSASTVTSGISDTNMELVSLTSSQEQVVMNDIHFGEDYFSILNDGLDDLFRNCDVPAPHPAQAAVQRSPLGPMPTLMNCSNITFNFNFNIQK